MLAKPKRLLFSRNPKVQPYREVLGVRWTALLLFVRSYNGSKSQTGMSMEHRIIKQQFEVWAVAQSFRSTFLGADSLTSQHTWSNWLPKDRLTSFFLRARRIHTRSYWQNSGMLPVTTALRKSLHTPNLNTLTHPTHPHPSSNGKNWRNRQHGCKQP